MVRSLRNAGRKKRGKIPLAPVSSKNANALPGSPMVRQEDPRATLQSCSTHGELGYKQEQRFHLELAR
jgi:hypothetical protein